jgi:hypothetical protein
MKRTPYPPVSWLALLLSACAALQPPAPKLGPPPPNPPPQASVIALPIRVPMPQLAAKLNNSVSRQLYKAKNIDIGSGQRLSLEVNRGPITLRTVDGRLTAAMRLRANLDIDGQVLGVRHHEDGEVELKVTVATRLVVNGDYQLTSQTTGNIDVDKAEVKLGPFRISIKDQVEDRIRPRFKEFLKELDQRIVGHIDLKGVLGRAWTEMAHPIRIAESPETWLLIQPRTLRFAAPRSEGDELIFGFAVECLTGVWLLRKPAPAETGGLPQLVLGGAPEGTLRLAFPMSIGHREASRIATDALSRKPFQLKAGIKLHVKRAQVSGSGAQLVTRVDFKADAGGLGGSDGYLYFTGRPVYDQARREMRVEDFDYDLGTRDLISRGADWLLHKEFVRAVQKELVFPFGKRMDETRASLNDPAKVIRAGNFATVRIQIDKVAPAAALEVTPSDLRVYVLVEGSLEMRLGVP